ncbi:cocaine- and amphetamine-regulated transcript protein-like [Pelobates fuscus]|uniref:cocaine- and amphetamine-regulated transcript protein-like n=1 Tax=Pelobates fuscus TaxID=191477 RepID=UPI002FE4FA5C
MDKVRRYSPITLLLAVCISALIVASKGEDSIQVQSEEDRLQPSNSLAVALEEMLEYNQNKGISLQKKASQVPRCDVGERCAIKHGPRIGKLCDCLRGTSCNTFLLRCY